MRISAISAVLFLCAADLPAQTSTTRMTAVPDLRIGSVDGGPAAFGLVSALAVGPAGAIYVGDGQAAEVRVFDARGRYLRSFGRKGKGPGEFQDIRTIGWRGDTVWVTDRVQARAALFSPAGTAVRTLSPQISARQRGVLGYGPEAVLGDESLLASAAIRTDLSGPREWPPVLRVDADGAVLDTLFHLDQSNSILTIPGDGGRLAGLSASQPFADHPRYAIAPDGSAVVRVDRRAARQPEGATYRVTRIDPATGDTLFSRAWRYTPRPVPQRMVDSLVRAWTEHAGRAIASAGRAERAAREALYLPAFLPTVTAVVAGRDGTTWLRREEPSGASVRWTILDPRGTPVAEVMLPRGARVMQAERSTAWAVVRGELDEQYVVRYRLRPARARR